MSRNYTIENKMEVVSETQGTNITLVLKEFTYVNEAYMDVVISWKTEDLRKDLPISELRRDFSKPHSFALMKSFLRTKKWTFKNHSEILL